MSTLSNLPYIRCDIYGIDSTYVCAECGSDKWHLNIVVKAHAWYDDPDCANYCADCTTMDGRIVSPKEYEEIKNEIEEVT